MGEGSTDRVFIPDTRGADRYMRVTWHKQSATVVFSHWSGDVCVASTPVTLPDASKVIDLVVHALRQAAAAPATAAHSEGSGQPTTAAILERIRRLISPKMAEIVDFGHKIRPDQGKQAGG